MRARDTALLACEALDHEPIPNYGVSLQRQAEYRSYSERIAYYNSRVAAFSQYLLTDDSAHRGHQGLRQVRRLRVRPAHLRRLGQAVARRLPLAAGGAEVGLVVDGQPLRARRGRPLAPRS
jgi:hypothetical protein